MNRSRSRKLATRFLVALLPVVVVACGRARVASAPTTPAAPGAPGAPSPAAHSLAPSPAAPEELLEAPPAPHPALARLPGDFVVFRYSGSFRKAPLTLTERVVAREGTVLIVDFTLADGKKEQTLRVNLDYTPGARGDVSDVRRMENGVARASSRDEWEAMMAKTIVSADANEEDLGTEDVNVAVAGTPSAPPIAARKTSWRVTVGGRTATLSITRPSSDDAFAWGDLGGEIRAADGVIYRAELVQMGSGAPAPGAKIAKTD